MHDDEVRAPSIWPGGRVKDQRRRPRGLDWGRGVSSEARTSSNRPYAAVILILGGDLLCSPPMRSPLFAAQRHSASRGPASRGRGFLLDYRWRGFFLRFAFGSKSFSPSSMRAGWPSLAGT